MSQVIIRCWPGSEENISKKVLRIQYGNRAWRCIIMRRKSWRFDFRCSSVLFFRRFSRRRAWFRGVVCRSGGARCRTFAKPRTASTSACRTTVPLCWRRKHGRRHRQTWTLRAALSFSLVELIAWLLERDTTVKTRQPKWFFCLNGPEKVEGFFKLILMDLLAYSMGLFWIAGLDGQDSGGVES